MRTSDIGIALIAQFEGFPNGGRPYNDPVGFATVGYGHLIARRPVNQADRSDRWLRDQKTAGVLTLAEAKRLLRKDLVSRERAVERLVKVPLTQGQFDCLVSFIFNVGEGAFESSSLRRKLNQRDYAGAADALMLWNKAGNPLRVFEGLTRRRKAERARFLAGSGGSEKPANRTRFTATEQRLITEYDRLVAARRDPHRREQLRKEMTLQRKRIWRRAQPLDKGGDGRGWSHFDRRERYRALLHRTQ